MENDSQDRNNERIVDLTTAQKVTNDHLDKVDETLDSLDRSIRGDYDNNRSGLVSRVEALEHDSAMYKAVLFQDPTGKKGLVATVENLVAGRLEKLERRKLNYGVIIAIISSTVLVIRDLDKIGWLWNHFFGEKIVAAKPHGRHRSAPEP